MKMLATVPEDPSSISGTLMVDADSLHVLWCADMGACVRACVRTHTHTQLKKKKRLGKENYGVSQWLASCRGARVSQ